MAAEPRFLWVSKHPIPQNVQDAMRDVGQLHPYDQDKALAAQLGDTAVAVVCPDEDGSNPECLASTIGEIRQSSAVGVFLLPRDSLVAQRIVADQHSQVICTAKDAAPEQLAGQLTAALNLQPAISRLHVELEAARRTGAEAKRTVEELDEEMRLAARLQRDFLPRRLPEVGPAKFAALYRPFTWVSGDIYDVVRLDETHVGFYVADVVGHGMPAALLTMFIKKALQTKRIVGHTYEIIPPHVTLNELNVDICEQDLPSCQFCTAVYCVLDTDRLLLTFARGGHPEPVVLRRNGEIERLWVEGSLLGVFPEEEFFSQTYQLHPGDRLILYTDGAEELLRSDRKGQILSIDQGMGQWSCFTRQEMLLQLAAAFEPGNPNPSRDDVTVLVLDIED